MCVCIVVRGVPAKLFGRDLHRRGQLHLVGFDELLPARGAVIAETGGVFPAQGIDERLDRASVLFRFFEHGV